MVNKVTHPLRRAATPEEYAAVTDHSKRAENVLNGPINGISFFVLGFFSLFLFHNERKKVKDDAAATCHLKRA